MGGRGGRSVKSLWVETKTHAQKKFSPFMSREYVDVCVCIYLSTYLSSYSHFITGRPVVPRNFDFMYYY